MGVVLAFLVGWAVGARGGAKGYDEVVAAGKEVWRSEEFAGLVSAVRSHTVHVLRELAEWLHATSEQVEEQEDVLTRARRLVRAGGMSKD